MDRTELLKKIKEENETREPYMRDAELVATRIGAIAAAVVAVLFFTVEWILTGTMNVGLFLSVAAMAATAFSVYAIKVRTAYYIILATVSSIVFAAVAVMSVVGFAWGVI